MLAAACSDTGDDQSLAASAPSETSARPATDSAVSAGAAADSGECDDLDTSSCLLPWPNDRFARADDATPTGLRVDLPADGVPVNDDGVPIEVADQNRSDGFSPSSMPMVVVPGLDLEASGLPPSTDIGASLAEDSPLVLLDVTTGERVAAWAELDAASDDPTRAPLIVVPATALLEGHTHVVALRGLATGDGQAVDPNQAYLDRLNDPDAHTQLLIDALDTAGMEAADFDVAWSFTVASGEALSGRLRHMWDETQRSIEQRRPDLTVAEAETSGNLTTLSGTFDVPNYLTGDGGPGETMNLEDPSADDAAGEARDGANPAGVPRPNGTLAAEFLCTVPTPPPAEQPAPGTPGAPVVLYGHGLLGSKDEVRSIGALGASVGIAFCALDWIGMSAADVPSVVDALADLSQFRTVPDRLQQGHLAWLTFGRLLATANVTNFDPAFFGANDTPLLDPRRISFLGASQGGILGGAPSALTEDWGQVILGVPGMGYNLLLPRSIDFDRFAPAIEESYPDPLDRAIARELIQMLWDRGENAGWAQHLTHDTYDGVPEKNVLLLEAFGDHQVANVSTEKLARTLGLPRRAPTLAPDRSNDVEPFFGIDEIEALPTGGSGLVVWDFQTPAPPANNVPPREGDDPHSKLATEAGALAMVAAFIGADQELIDVCDARPCATPAG